LTVSSAAQWSFHISYQFNSHRGKKMQQQHQQQQQQCGYDDVTRLIIQRKILISVFPTK